MKLFVIATLIAVAAAARLENLERAYLPPFGSNGGSFGANNGAFGQAGSGLNNYNAGAAAVFPGATSNQYLPPDHGPSSNGAPEFAGSLTGFGSQNYQQHIDQQHHQQYPSSHFGGQTHGSFGASNYQAQFPSANRQYLAPSASLQNPPQQAFDEQTGYHY